MVSVRFMLATLTLCLALLSGCLGDDKEQLDPDDDGGKNVAEDGATIKGQVFDVDLTPINQARMSLVDPSAEVAAEGTSDEDGRYVLRGIEPGSYRLTVSAACCEEAIENIRLEANDEVEKSFMLEPYSDDDLKIPYDAYDEATVFIACQFTLPTGYSSGCGVVEGNIPTKAFSIGKGLRTIIAAAKWQAGGGVSDASELEFRMRTASGDIYGQESGSSPLEIRVDNSEIGDDVKKFEEYDETGFTLILGARPAPGAVVYQQAVDLYWHLFYWEEAPSGISVLPDA